MELEAYGHSKISIHALREEGDGIVCLEQSRTTYFYPPPRRGGRPSDRLYRLQRVFFFYPRPPGGGRPLSRQRASSTPAFLSTPSARRATHARALFAYIQAFLSTPSARRATGAAQRIRSTLKISIHALREEGDAVAVSRKLLTEHFYPRPPRGGRRGCWQAPCWPHQYFYPRPPRGGRPRCFFVFAQSFVISIHALREEGDIP